MKKYILAVSSFLFLLCISCNNPGGDAKTDDIKMNNQSKRNLDATHIIYNAYHSGDIGKIDSVIATTYVNHTSKGDIGIDTLKARIVKFYAASKDAKFEIIKELADDEYVFSRMRFTGTTDGSAGMPAGSYNMRLLEVFRFKDGKAVEQWVFAEPKEMGR